MPKDQEDEISHKIALQKLVKSEWWKLYISILSEYATKYSSILMKVDPSLSELKYNTKDMNVIFLQNIDLLTSIPELYIASIEETKDEQIPLEKMVQNDYDRLMNEAYNYVTWINQSL